MQNLTALKRGIQRVYFPDFPNHPLNGASADRFGPFTGEENGLKKRTVLTVFEATDHNISRPSGYWDDTFSITPDMFGAEKVKVKFWFCGYEEQTFILEK